MNILLVDDMDERRKALRDILDRAGVPALIRHRKHVAEVDMPGDVEWADALFLDHDLCVAGDGEPCPKVDQTFKVGCRCPDGRDLTDRIIALGIRRPVVIQSANISGGPEMLRRFMVADGWRAVWSPAPQWFGVTAAGLVRRWGLAVPEALR